MKVDVLDSSSTASEPPSGRLADNTLANNDEPYDWETDAVFPADDCPVCQQSVIATWQICVGLLLVAVVAGVLVYLARAELAKQPDCNAAGVCQVVGNQVGKYPNAVRCQLDSQYTCWRTDGQKLAITCDARVCSSAHPDDARRTDTWPCGEHFTEACWWRAVWMNGTPTSPTSPPVK